MHDCAHHAPKAGSRRRFLQTITLGGGAALLSSLPASKARAGHCKALLLSCMDYRLTDKTEAYMESRGLKEDYDHLVLAGASLGALTDKYPEWGKAFRDQLGIAKTLHHIETVLVLDHRDCGAYKVFLGEEAVKDAATETASHATYLRKLRAAIKGDHPDLNVELGIMALDGTVEAVS